MKDGQQAAKHSLLTARPHGQTHAASRLLEESIKYTVMALTPWRSQGYLAAGMSARPGPLLCAWLGAAAPPSMCMSMSIIDADMDGVLGPAPACDTLRSYILSASTCSIWFS